MVRSSDLQWIEKNPGGIIIIIAGGISLPPGGQRFPAERHDNLLAPVDWLRQMPPFLNSAFVAIKAKLPEIDLLAGNVGTFDGACALIKAGADAIKVGIGPGSICTTRVVTGAGVPQISAIQSCVEAARGSGAPIISDGGVKFSGDMAKAIAAGADVVMIGSLFAGTEEAPGEVILYQGRSFKMYRGMGSIGAMREGSRDRYAQEQTELESKLVPEGIEGRVPYRGTLAEMVTQLVGGLRSGMGYTGCRDIKEFQEKTRFLRVTAAGLRESHVHDVVITKEAPNYRLE